MEQTLTEVDFILDEIAPEAKLTEKKPQAVARLIEYAQDQKIALPPHTTYGLIEHPVFVAVPGSAKYAYGLMTWQYSRIPLLNLEMLLNDELYIVPTETPRYALIVAYQSHANYPMEFGAIGLNALPKTILVGDEAQCSFPDDRKIWQFLALSCFQLEGQAIPILDSSKLFSSYHRSEIPN
jgi:hypothetical protein